MKNIRNVTYCTWTSFGSVLQTFGLKRTLSKIGFNSRIWLHSDSKHFPKTKIKSCKSFLRRIYQILIHKQRLSAFQKRNHFIDTYLDIDYFSSYEEFITLTKNQDYDIALAGSDQIWNPSVCNPVFFLSDVNHVKKISYAASMKHTNMEPHQAEQIGSWVNRFDYISVREEACANKLSSVTNKPIEVNIDPTFLVSADEWRTFEFEYPIKQPYILLYMLYWDKTCVDKIKTLKKQTGLPVYAIADGLTGVYADKVFYDVGIEEFLWLIDHADYVVTSSFHGTAFSIIFNKKFAAVINPASPSRITHLLNTLSIPLVSIDHLAQTQEFNYTLTNEKIAEEREKSFQYLKKVLSE